MVEKKYIVGLGEALWDLLPDGRKIGGAPANFAYHVSQFGLESRVVSAVGCDALGDEILSNFESKGLEGVIARVAYPTGTVQVELDGGGVPQYNICEGVAWDNIPFTAQLEALAKQCRAVCFGSLAQRDSLSHDTICRFLDTMDGGVGQYKIFDINLRQDYYTREIIHQSLIRCNILKINDDEVKVVAELFSCAGDSFPEICRELLLRYDLEMVILTCGTNGSYLFTPTSQSFIETPRVEVGDTVGAGDSFTASFTAALLRGKSIEQAHRLAVDVSAFVCTQRGAMPLLPARFSVE